MTENADLDGPEFEMWNHLHSAIDTARDELRVFDAESRKVVEELGHLIAFSRTAFVLQRFSDKAALVDAVQALVADRWFRHAAEIEIADAGVNRVSSALDRFIRLRPIKATREVPDRAVKYLREALDAYLFGFDAACIAFCRATCEQVLKDALVAAKRYTEPQLKRERPSAGTLLRVAQQQRLLERSFEAASRLTRRGDAVMHQFIADNRILPQHSLDSLHDLAEVLEEALA